MVWLHSIKDFVIGRKGYRDEQADFIALMGSQADFPNFSPILLIFGIAM